jgi:hypothetical protein
MEYLKCSLTTLAALSVEARAPLAGPATVPKQAPAPNTDDNDDDKEIEEDEEMMIHYTSNEIFAP